MSSLAEFGLHPIHGQGFFFTACLVTQILEEGVNFFAISLWRGSNIGGGVGVRNSKGGMVDMVRRSTFEKGVT